MANVTPRPYVAFLILHVQHSPVSYTKHKINTATMIAPTIPQKLIISTSFLDWHILKEIPLKAALLNLRHPYTAII